MEFKGAMLAHNFKGNEDVTEYYISEKLDGIRAFYLGNGQFVSRNNKPIVAPKWFTDTFPRDIVIDGELFTRRGDFANISSIVRKKVPVDTEWRALTFMIIDIPGIPGVFEDRYDKALELFKDAKHARVIEQKRITSIESFTRMHDALVENGAEGSMLRKSNSQYEYKRSKMLLKVKNYFDDEAIVSGYAKGLGKYAGVLGNLVVKWKQDSKKYKGEFKVGSGFTDDERANYKTLFEIGTVVTVKYWELQPSGKPRFPIYMRIRDE